MRTSNIYRFYSGEGNDYGMITNAGKMVDLVGKI